MATPTISSATFGVSVVLGSPQRGTRLATATTLHGEVVRSEPDRDGVVPDGDHAPGQDESVHGQVQHLHEDRSPDHHLQGERGEGHPPRVVLERRPGEHDHQRDGPERPERAPLHVPSPQAIRTRPAGTASSPRR